MEPSLACFLALQNSLQMLLQQGANWLLAAAANAEPVVQSGRGQGWQRAGAPAIDGTKCAMGFDAQLLLPRRKQTDRWLE